MKMWFLLLLLFLGAHEAIGAFPRSSPLEFHAYQCNFLRNGEKISQGRVTELDGGKSEIILSMADHNPRSPYSTVTVKASMFRLAIWDVDNLGMTSIAEWFSTDLPEATVSGTKAGYRYTIHCKQETYRACKESTHSILGQSCKMFGIDGSFSSFGVALTAEKIPEVTFFRRPSTPNIHAYLTSGDDSQGRSIITVGLVNIATGGGVETFLMNAPHISVENIFNGMLYKVECQRTSFCKTSKR